MRSSRQSAWWIRLVTYLALLASGCCSETPRSTLPAPPGKPDPLVLTTKPETWKVTEGGMGEVDLATLPYVDLERLIEDRLRWRAWALAWQAQHDKEVSSGE